MKTFVDALSFEIAEAVLKGVLDDMKKNISAYDERELISACIVIDAITRIVEQVSERFKIESRS